MRQTAATFALLCALAGLTVSVMAANVHYHMLHDPTYTSFCDVSETVSCTQVYASRFSTFRGVPVAIFGAIWFAFAALMSAAWLTARPAIRESVPGYLFAGSTLALAVALYMGYASFVLLKLVCILCVITYAAVIGLFLVSGAATSLPMLQLPRRAAQDFKVMLATPLALILAVLWLGASRPRSRSFRARRRPAPRERFQSPARISGPSSNGSCRRRPGCRSPSRTAAPRS